MTNKKLICGDIHGNIGILNNILRDWEKVGTEETKLIFLGDYVDRGKNSKEVLKKLYEVKTTHKDRDNLVLLWGNHDSMMYNTLVKGKPDYWVGNNGMYETMQSFGIEDSLIRDFNMYIAFVNDAENNIREHHGNQEMLNIFTERLDSMLESYRECLNDIYPKVLEEFHEIEEFYELLGDVYEDDDLLVAHAGLDFRLDNYLETPKYFREWARELFYNDSEVYGKAPDKVCVFGHTPTKYFGSGKYNPVRLGKSIYFIDGGSFITGKQNLFIVRGKDVLGYKKV